MTRESYFKVSTVNGCLYHIEANWFIDKDYDMAQKLQMTTKQYRKLLIDKFNGVRHDNEVYFINKGDLHKALAYLDEIYDRILIIRKLAGEV